MRRRFNINKDGRGCELGISCWERVREVFRKGMGCLGREHFIEDDEMEGEITVGNVRGSGGTRESLTERLSKSLAMGWPFIRRRY